MHTSNSFSCIKCCVMLLNLFFVISGIIITSLGVYLKVFYYCYEPFVHEQYLYAPDFLIILGVIILLISFIGCCGIITQNSCASLIFTTFLVLILFFEMGLGLAGYIMKEETKDYLQERLPATMAKYTTSADIRLAWDTLQNTFNCCGAKSPRDWEKVNLTIPNSCYGYSINGTKSLLHEDGCIETFGNFVRQHSNYIEVSGLIFSMIQLLVIISSCLLTSEYRKGYETV
ncbi:Tetraspannin [Oryctes borbonicus]|uniref:Tetraspanin n=1 Tax=Oryctes borbonicus TaxID=1629725 RepID=A0A0T6AVJ2_9SCAR|nr:Tetraspannin [Oryctes borbonicus]